eukprot:TRINITY_DN2420_c0_g2_i1.p1 TRINITY_DN2420_c0_g2~~TRINITY_DN2420_c0_g2_i1.p1  ORF type:complete len:326 (-),score=86.33 TRINITY_DN2420_c0_g2_i1:190-1047(-)
MEVEASEDAAKLATEAHERVIRHVAKRILVNKKKALTDLKESVAKLHRLVDKCEQAKQAEIKKNAKRAFKELSDPLKVPALCPAKQKLQFTNYKQLKAVVNSSLRIIKEKHSLDLPDSALEKILVRLSSEKDTHAFCGVCHVFKDVIDKAACDRGQPQKPCNEDHCLAGCCCVHHITWFVHDSKVCGDNVCHAPPRLRVATGTLTVNLAFFFHPKAECPINLSFVTTFLDETGKEIFRLGPLHISKENLNACLKNKTGWGWNELTQTRTHKLATTDVLHMRLEFQ